MAQIVYEGQQTDLLPGETVLDALLRLDPSVPYSCRAGLCQSCLMKATRGEVTPKSQVGLKASWVSQGYFLPCVCVPDGDLEIAGLGNEIESTSCRIESVERLCEDVARVRLRPDKPLLYRAGQYVSLVREDGLSRSYSIASLPDERLIELHVGIVPNGQMSTWLSSGEAVGQTVSLRGPLGECFYLPEDDASTLVLIGSGTGLAPLYGIARDAIRSGYPGQIALYHAAKSTEHHYLHDDLSQLSSESPSLRYLPVTEQAEGELVRRIMGGEHAWPESRIYLCGSPTMVNQLRKKLYLLGADLSRIHADAFVTRAK
ncbi:FAD-binding oxidoreductase [Lacunimicrobium album]